MVHARPHFLLFSRAEWSATSPGSWHFSLQSVDGEGRIEASDAEPGLRKERLELLAVVRGLEALDQPSRVTLVTPSQRIARGFRSGLEEWRSCRWQWQRDGRWVPINNRDLWQRVDRALLYHGVDCRSWRFDPVLVDDRSSDGVSHKKANFATGARSTWSWPHWHRKLHEAARPAVRALRYGTSL